MKLVTYDTGDGVGRPGALVNDGTAIADLAANSGGAVASVLWIAQGGESALAQAEDAAKGAATVALDAVRLMAPIEPPPQMRDCLCFETHLIQAFQQARKLRASQMPDPAAAILGCTHYPLMEEIFQDALGDNVRVFSQASLVAESLADYLERRPEMVGPGTESLFLTTGNPRNVSNRATQFLRRKIEFIPA